MSKILIANLGTSDFNYDGGTYKNNKLFDYFPEYKNKFQELLITINKNYKEYKSKIKFPILDTLIKELNVNEIILIYTKQNPIHDRDTYLIFEIAKNYFEEKTKIFGLSYINNPTDIDQLNEFFKKELNKLKNNYEKIYISTTAGTPQMNQVIELTAFELIQKDNLKVYQVKEKGDGSSLLQIKKFTKLFEAILFKSVIKNLIKNYDYLSISDLIKKYGAYLNDSSEEINKNIRLSEFTDSIMNFDFIKARKLKNEELLYYFPENNFVDLEEQDLKWKLIHFIDTLIIFIKLEKWVDFASRNYAFADSLLYYFLNKLLIEKENINLQEENGKPTSDFMKYYESNKELSKYLESKFRGIEISKDKSLNFPHKLYIYKFLNNTNSMTIDYLKRTESFNTKFRNKSHIAHGFGTITKENFNEFLKPEDYEDLRRHLTNNSENKNKFDLINDELLKFIS